MKKTKNKNRDALKKRTREETDSGVPKEPFIRWGSGFPMERGDFEGNELDLMVAAAQGIVVKVRSSFQP